MARAKLPLIYSLEEHSEDGTTEAYIQNAWVNKTDNNRLEIVKRPGLKAISSTALATAPRGVFEHGNSGQLMAGSTGVYYTVTTPFDTLYTGSFWAVNANRIDFAYAGGYVVAVNYAQGSFGQGYTLNIVTHTMSAITDTDFPPNSNITIARGVIDIDGYMLILTRGGLLYHSDNGDATSWTATSFVSMNNPGGTAYYITKQQKYAVLFSDSAIEFFYNAGNTSGSAFSPRRDLSYDVGLIDYNAIWSDNETIAFVSSPLTGRVGVYMMQGLQLKKISNPDIDQAIDETLDDMITTMKVRVGGFQHNGRTFIVVTISLDDDYSWVYDTLTQGWFKWSYNDSHFTVVGALRKTYTDTTTLFFLANTQASYFENRTYQDDITNGSSQVDINVQIQTPKFTGQSGEHGLPKTMNEFFLAADRGASTNNVQVEITDDDYQNYTNLGNIDVSDVNNRLFQLGEFQERAFRLTHTANLPLRLQYAEIEYDAGVS